MKTFVAILVIILLGGAAWFYMKPSTTQNVGINEPVATTTVPVMQTYTNAPHAFSLQYPENYVAVEGGSTSSVVSFFDRATYNATVSNASSSASSTPTEGPTAITAQSFPNPKGLTALAWASSTKLSNFSLGTGENMALEISGREAIVYQWSGLYQGISIAIDNKAAKTIEVLSVTFNATDDKIVADFERVYQSFVYSN